MNTALRRVPTIFSRHKMNSSRNSHSAYRGTTIAKQDYILYINQIFLLTGIYDDGPSATRSPTPRVYPLVYSTLVLYFPRRPHTRHPIKGPAVHSIATHVRHVRCTVLCVPPLSLSLSLSRSLAHSVTQSLARFHLTRVELQAENSVLAAALLVSDDVRQDKCQQRCPD